MTLLSIIIPVYNSQDCLDQLQKKINKEIEHDHEIIFVNDESEDNSWQVIKNIADNNKDIIGINLLKNVGQDNAIMAGLSFAKGDYIIIMDDDDATWLGWQLATNNNINYHHHPRRGNPQVIIIIIIIIKK